MPYNFVKYFGQKLHQRGDTIVEVLLSVTVVTAVLAGAFVSADSSNKNTRRAQERGEALKLTEAHLERFRATASTKNLLNKAESEYYCIDDSLAIIPLNPPYNLDDFTATYLSGCAISPQGGVTYYISIKRLGSDFTLRTKWDSFGRNFKEDLHISYRQY